MDAFLMWLSENHAFEKRSGRDVASRIKRAAKLIDIDSDLTDDELLFRLNSLDEFKVLSSPVKSQMKRAIKLYRTYKVKLD